MRRRTELQGPALPPSLLPGGRLVAGLMGVGLVVTSWLAISHPLQRSVPRIATIWPDMLIDPNRATEAQLDLLPGVGPELARRIVRHRDDQGRFRSVAALTHVRGIGPRTLERVQPFVVIDNSLGQE